MGKCDFCSTPTGDGKRGYRAAAQITVKTPEVNYVDCGEWVGCVDCSELIERKDWKALMKRAQKLNPALRAATQQGHLRAVSEFVAVTWSAIFDQPTQAFL